jgi:hypothetical protein
MKLKLLPLFLLCLLLGCSLSKKQALELAVSYEKGLSQVPAGYYIFIELGGWTEYSDQCQRAPGRAAPGYEFTSSGELVSFLPVNLPASSSPILGFFGYGGVSGRDMLYVIDELPYQMSQDSRFTIYSVDAQGVATVGVDSLTYYIKPGQAWTDGGEMGQSPPAGCRVKYSTSLTNHGLLPQAKITLGSPWPQAIVK